MYQGFYGDIYVRDVRDLMPEAGMKSTVLKVCGIKEYRVWKSKALKVSILAH